MLLNALLQIGLFLIPAASSEAGHNFLVVFDDVDGALAGQTPVLWALIPGETSLQFSLLDSGLNADPVGESGKFTGMVNELPPVEVQLSLQTDEGEIWRDSNFLVSADLSYPALRLRLEKGRMSGGLVSDPSPGELLARRISSLKSSEPESPKWFKLFLAFVSGVLVLRIRFFLFSKDRRWRIVRSVRLARGHSWSLGQGLPVLHDGLQLWVFSDSTRDVRARIQKATQDLGQVFWLPFQGADGLSPDGVRVWSGATPTGGELIGWRDADFDPTQPGPLFVEGLQGVRRGELSVEEWLFDLSEMTSGPVVLLIPQGEPLPKGALDLHQV
jgi:hypothetical protein